MKELIRYGLAAQIADCLYDQLDGDPDAGDHHGGWLQYAFVIVDKIVMPLLDAPR